MDSQLMTTGDVARLCGVTPDAVLKWIKAGKLPATRTPGGHYRVARSVCEELGLGQPPQEEQPEQKPEVRSVPEETRCWEFFGDGDNPRDTCLSCVVYLSRAQHCYRLAEIGEQTGHTRRFCGQDDCEPCSFYRACHGMASAVLVVTRDEALARRLGRDIDAAKVTLRTARSGYEASQTIATFHPALVILDTDVPEVKDGQLPEAIMQDDRVPGMVVFVACREGHEVTIDSVSAPSIDAPFSARRVEDLADALRRRGAAAGGIA